MEKLKHMLGRSAKVSLRLSFLLPVGVIWGLVAGRYEPFRSHFWLTFFCEVLSTVAVLIAAFFVVWLWKRTKLRGDNELS
jgi:TRAP-type uncharacterized transport system fused permease subunit